MALLDVLKVKEFKSQIEKLINENDKLNSDLTQLRGVRLSAEQMSLIELQDEINRKIHEKEELEAVLQQISSDVREKQRYIMDFKDKIKELERQLIVANEDLEMESYGLYRPMYDFATALGYKEKLDEIRGNQKELMKRQKAVDFFSDWKVDGSKAKGRKMTNDNIKIMLRAFNNECEAAINKVRYNNIETVKQRIYNSFTQINKLNEVNRCSLTKQFYDLKIAELYLAYEYERKKEEEKEALREQREKEREEKALQKEIDSKKKIIDKEIKHITNILEELELKLVTASDSEREALVMKIQELKDNIRQFEEEKEELDWRLVHAAAGYVYIISNIGSFGEGVFKIGVTRRLDPLDRISELSSASVPFKFDVHALVFSHNAYQLENDLHKKFSANRINMVNNRKEFFKLEIEEIKKALEQYKDLTIDFNEIPAAEEYRESSKIILQ